MQFNLLTINFMPNGILKLIDKRFNFIFFQNNIFYIDVLQDNKYLMQLNQLYSPHQMKQLQKRLGQNLKPLSCSIIDNIFIVGLIIIQACTLNGNLVASLYNFQNCTIDFSQINSLLQEVSHRYQGYLASVLVEMLIYEDNNAPNIDVIEEKISYFKNNSGKISLMNPMTNIQLREFIARQVMLGGPNYSQKNNNNNNGKQAFATPIKLQQNGQSQLTVINPQDQNIQLVNSFISPALQSPQVHQMQNVQSKVISIQCPLKSSNYCQNLKFNHTPIGEAQQLQIPKSEFKLKQLNQSISLANLKNSFASAVPAINSPQVSIYQNIQPNMLNIQRTSQTYYPQNQKFDFVPIQENSKINSQRTLKDTVQLHEFQLEQKVVSPKNQIRSPSSLQRQLSSPQQSQLSVQEIQIMKIKNFTENQTQQTIPDGKSSQQLEDETQDESPMYEDLKQKMNALLQKLEKYEYTNDIQDLVSNTKSIESKKNQQIKDKNKEKKKEFDLKKEVMKKVITTTIDKQKKKQKQKKKSNNTQTSQQQCGTKALTHLKQQLQIDQNKINPQVDKKSIDQGQIYQKVDNKVVKANQYVYYTKKQQVPTWALSPKIQGTTTMRSYSQIHDRMSLNHNYQYLKPIIQLQCNINQSRYQLAVQPNVINLSNIAKNNYYQRQYQYSNAQIQQ